MARSSTLKPAFRQERASKDLLPWCVNVPRLLSKTGRRQQLFFATQGEAKTECAALKVRKSNFGDSLTAMTPARIAEAAEAYKLLDPLKIGLLDAVRSHVAVVNARALSVTFSEAFDRFAESKKSKSPKYLQEIRQAKATFEPLLARMVCDITASDLEPILNRLPDGSRNAKMRRLRSVFNLAAKREWMRKDTNPVLKLDFADGRRDEVQVFPVETIWKLLEHALNEDIEFLPYRVFTFFCGIRPEGEIERLDWSDVHIAEKTVVLRPEITKTKRKRFVDLSDNAITWITEYQVRGGNATGLVAPWTPQVRRTKHRTSYRACGITKWIQQGARHSFCSYWLALHKDANKLVLQSGHTNADTMWTRYHAGVTEAEAKRFWEIRPERSDLNVVAMTA